MKINLKQAVKLFFANPSLELVFIEAIANSMDANATKIDIDISIDKFANQDTLKISFKDNGDGFTDERFLKFCELLKVEEETHKGIGRLVFLSYFKSVDVSSKYNNKHRTFNFSTDFDEKSIVNDITDNTKETILTFNNYYLKKISSHKFLSPPDLIKRIKEEFYPKLYSKKQEGKEFEISISLDVQNPEPKYDFISETKKLNVSELGDLKVEPIDASIIEMFKDMNVHYSIIQRENEKTIITALCIDERSFKLDIITDENIPLGYEVIFLLYSSIFVGQVDPSRQSLTINEQILKPLISLFRTKVTEILLREIPIIQERNNITKESLINHYPHLLGYFEEDTIGFIKRDESIKKAQDKFFKAQKEVLDAPNNLSEDIYEKSLELSSRALTEYILYRQIIINKLKLIDKKSSEPDIHNLIIPMRKKLYKSNFMSDLYSNNAWLLDDKYMTYNTILSDKIMSDVIKEITKDETVETDTTEPDIALIFSNDPNTSEKVDVVIVELKKKNLNLSDNVTAIVQLQQRATKLMKYYPNKIQRIWFYAIVEFNDDVILYLKNNGFTELFSIDSVYYNEFNIQLDLKSSDRYPIGLYIMSINSLINDADVRNSTFLRVLKESFKSSNQS
ncbi:ATP-binding protein [Cytophaga hutchinsonii]|uniref:ATP-binding protein n=1 Tax=Cytophaga hutchinsonii (strain ATCC 33406 / DSM 1761 / CIP 103989 / NBRC 15051 / NCIMB 9469 / D465) TaxID=269798 RepID=A0A6N4SR09_CYTH3|nr:ATP-binding protein [Cytophaga hutchinsonii]ABG58768.1 conserved hypothetical protein; possible histidine kinase [Cytophaga hutchinsonii ATCC 33406]SFX61379.1 Histidine kinase-, DNA gyrase B-, and HSP90-like ATPase [Cytophaga hutchinsonii ATCC 33406]